jgi:prolyl 4-hydroxylase
MSDTIQLKSEYEGAEVFSSEPLVAVRNDVISPIECAYLIELAKPHIKRAGVVLDEGFKPSEGRTGSNHWLKYDEDDVVKSIGQRIADIVGLPLENAESMQIIHYGPEQEYRPHFDAFNLSLARGQKAAQWGGQRLVTALVYLNKVEGGGATQFPKLGITVPASPGRMVIFHNTTEDISGPHPLSLHAGMPVEAGEKWAFNLWFRHHDTKEMFDKKKPLPSVTFCIPANTANSQSTPANRESVLNADNTMSQTVAEAATAPRKQSSQPSASDKVIGIRSESLRVVANRADVLWQRAVKTLKARDNHFPAVYLSYWDSYGNKPQPAAPNGWSAPRFSTVARSVLNPLSDAGKVATKMNQLGFGHRVPKTYASVQDALNDAPNSDDLWFIRSQFRGAKDKTLCLPTPIMTAATISSGHLLQRAVGELALIDQHKFTARFYAVVVGGQLMLFESSVAFIHGAVYSPNDANHASQVDNRSYRDPGSDIKLVPGSQTPHAAALEKASATLMSDMTGLLDETRAASVGYTNVDGAFAVLALDTLLTKSGDLKLLRIHTFPNFITTAQIDSDIHVPLFEDILRVMAGLPSRKLTTITD